MKILFDLGKVTLALAVIAVLDVSALAQATASDAPQHFWFFDISPSSAGFNLGVTDLGETTYNLVNSDPGAYSSFSGDGSGSVTVDPGTFFDGTRRGENAVMGNAASGLGGTAVTSIGSMETVRFTNLGGDGIYLDLSSALTFTPSVSVSGTSSASTISIGGYSYSGNDHYVQFTDDAVSGPAYTGSGSYFYDGTTAGQASFSALDEIVIGDGQSVTVSFYVGTFETAQAVPAPSGRLTLLAALCSLGVLRRRRRSP